MKKIKEIISSKIDIVLNKLSYPKKDFNLDKSRNVEFGDFSSNISLLLAKDLKKSPINIGNIIMSELNKISIPYITSISVTAPGFLNFNIDKKYFLLEIPLIIEGGINYGRGKLGNGNTANVEFVSANPTGPLTIGHGRNAILGDTISNLLDWQGYKVTREYYFNNAGRQMRLLSKSIESRYFQSIGKEIPFPDDGYLGEYIKDIAEEVLIKGGENLKSGDSIFLSEAEKIIFKSIKNCLRKLNIHFDSFINEKTFYENGAIKNIIDELRNKGFIYEKDGATWFKSSSLGKSKDIVFIKSSGEPTYRLPDTAYHQYKLKRGFNLIIDIFGSDHADTYPDILLALEALGHKTEHIKVLIYQFVTLLKGGEKVKMSTRKADFVTLDELISDVGPDVVRYFFIMRGYNSHLDFDLDLAKDQSDKNPVFYLQYAHARICNILSRSEQIGLSFNNYDTSLLTHENEFSLVKLMIDFKEVSERACKNLEPQNIANYLQDLSSLFHKFYSHCRVITEDEALTKSRLALIKSVKIILHNGLTLLGISAPERM